MRSQMAEAFYNHLTGTSDAVSAGAGTTNGRPVDSDVAQAMEQKGLDMSSHSSTVLTRDMFDEADKVIWFPTSFMPDYVKDSDKAEFWDIADPWYMAGGASYIKTARDEIEKLVKELIEQR